MGFGRTIIKKLVDEVGGVVQGRVGGPGGWAGPAASGAAGAASGGTGRSGSGGFTYKFVADELDEPDDPETLLGLGPALWLPTRRGGVRADLVKSYQVERPDQGQELYFVTFQLTSGEEVGLRVPFYDRETLCAWVDVVFPGSAFSENFPDELRKASTS